jgi:putative DNA primase/helicase
MLLHLTEEESGGFHFRGGSSTGKTTALRVAATVFGGPEYLRRWRATDNALEAVAAMHNDTVLILDELAQVDPRVAGQAAYMLANGEGKQRAHRTGTARPVLRWRTLVLSAGEISLAEHMRQDGKKAQAGQEVRLAEVPADARQGYGLFETLHGYADAAALSRALCASAAQSYGTAAPEFIKAVLRQGGDALRDEVRSMRGAFCRAVLPGKADGQAYRAANRFALVAVAGELASRWGITGWEAGEADEAARSCFRAWLEHRGGPANVEPARMVAQVKQFLERHGEARFVPWRSDGQHWAIKDRAGFRKPTPQAGTLEAAETFYVLPETFQNEVCAGFDYREVARALVAVGALKYDKKGHKFTQKVRLPLLGGTPSCYVILPSIWQTDEDGQVRTDLEEVETKGELQR